MTTSKLRGAELIAQGLKDAGATTVFSLSGNQIMPVYDALLDTGIRIVHTRHEGAAVYMAEASAQISGELGVALITAGPGFANGLSAIYSARESETPLLVLSGDSPVARDGRGAFQELDQCAAAAPMAKASFRCRNAAGMAEDIARAAAIALAGRPGPVHLALPDDVLRHAVAPEPAAASVSPAAALGAPSPDEISALAANLAAASRPILLAGPQFCRSAWKPRMRELAERLNVPVVTFESPRGLRAPRLGAFAEVIGQADMIVTLGKPLNFMVGFCDEAVVAGDAQIIQIDADQDSLTRDREAHGARRINQMLRSPAAMIDALLTADTVSPNAANAWRQDVEAAVSFRPADWSASPPQSGTIHSLDLGRAVAALVNRSPEMSLIIDGGEIGQWCQALADAQVAAINGPSGAIGASIPYAIGARATRPDQPVVTVMGDGTAGFYLAEFETAVRENLPFVAIIGNDAKWNAEHQIQLRDYGADRTFGCELTAARYDRVAAELGGHGECVTDIADIAPAIERAMASGKPACVNVMIEGHAAPHISRNT